jgi:nucleoside 2-deoxyribosyltransferase
MRIFIICPVREVTAEQHTDIERYVHMLEGGGWQVYWPERDTNQDDSIGDRICENNLAAMITADEVHVYWTPTSTGTLFDLGMAWALRKPLFLINYVGETEKKSFENLILSWQGGRP